MELPYLTRKSPPREKKPIIVATLNYCDIMNNPFEFYCQEYEKQLQRISQLFLTIISIYIPSYSKQFKWNMGKIDQKIRIGRYSPAFSVNVGIKNGKFMNRQEFEDKWESQFDKIPEAKEILFSQQQRNTTKLYDFILFHTLLSYVYQQKDFQKVIKNSPEKYLNTFGPFYQLSFLSEEKKLDKFMSSFKKIQADIFFLQQYSANLKEAIEKTNKYHVATDEAKDKLVIVKKSTFQIKKPVSEILTREELKDLTWSEDPSIMVVDNFIIINAHLSSKTEKNRKQLEIMKKSLLNLKKKYNNYHFIIGGDINSFMGNDGQFENIFNFYPEKQHELTTIKKRTMTQGQYHKGNIVVAQSKDKIISDLKIGGGSIRYITNEEVKDKELIPTDRHPFDHFVLVAYLERP